MVKRCFESFNLGLLLALVLLCVSIPYAEDSENVEGPQSEASEEVAEAPEASDSNEASTETSPADSASGVQTAEAESGTSEDEEEVEVEEEGFKISSLWKWPFNNVIQPLLNGLIYPIAKPVDYAFKNGVVDKMVELISFGEDNKILIYPAFNFKPGSQTMIGFNYRHRSALLERDYFVLQGNYYANGDVDMSARYSKHGLFGTPFFGGIKFDMTYDRDNTFVIPETKKSYLEPDSSFGVTWRLGTPLTKSADWNAELWTSLYFYRFSNPDIEDTILVSDEYPIEDRGLYQDVTQVPVGLSVVYDNLDFPYAPSRGNRFLFNATYTFVGKYSGIDYEDLGIERKDDEDQVLKDGGKNHDYIKTELVFQHYFFLGKAENYILSVKEARQNRKFYTDFSWEQAVRVWRPEQVRETLFERRVIAMQFRMIDLWEMEDGGAPHDAFFNVNARTPLRGYSDRWVTHHLLSLSMEYRWPVDRFVDGVLFNEYALIAPDIDEWSMSHYYNSWGFGIRVRMPNMYLFRMQFGFHGLHGMNLIMTIAPEFK